MMTANPNSRAFDNNMRRSGGLVWSRLRSEREDICEALLVEKPPSTVTSNEGAVSAANWRRDLLQARLSKIDDALDRLMSGSYGSCSKCRRWIEDTKLELDPAIEFCIECWQKEQRRISTQPLASDKRETGQQPISTL